MKIKLKETTEEQFKKWKSKHCGITSCANCFLRMVNCSSWVFNKDLYSDKFLNQEIEIEDEPILDEQEKAYLEAVLRPFKNRITFIEKREFLETMEYIICGIGYDDFLCFPYFVANEMYKGMELGKEYTPKELGLFQDE